MTDIKGKIAAIINDYEVVLNIGSEHGVTEGMIFVIYELGENIKNPENEEDLGKLEIIKGIIKIKNVQEKMSFAESFETKTKTVQNFAFTINLIAIITCDHDGYHNHIHPPRQLNMLL